MPARKFLGGPLESPGGCPVKGGRHDCQKLSAMQEDSQEERVAADLEVRRLRLGVK